MLFSDKTLGKQRTKVTLMIFALLVAGFLITSCVDSNQHQIETKATMNDPEAMKLVVSIPEKNIYLYGKDPSKDPEGVELHVGDRVQAFDWLYMTPRQILPVMQVQDYDADGQDELSVVLYVGSGTGYSVEQLHVVEINEEPMIDHEFADYLEQIDQVVGFKTATRSGEVSGEITIGTRIYPISFDNYKPQQYGRVDRLIFANNVGFYAEGQRLKAKFGVGVTYEKFASPEFIGELSADVTYKAGKFTLNGFNYGKEIQE